MRLCSLLLLAQLAVASLAAQTGFVESVFVQDSRLANLTGLGWAPDGSNRLFVITKTGAVRIVKNGAVLTAPFWQFAPIHTGSECGLIGFAFDPGFASNGFVYFFVTTASNRQQIIRLTASGDTGTAPVAIIDRLPTRGLNHDGGGIAFGYDGKLYWSIGDLGNKTGVDGDLVSFAAKVCRANPNGSVPFDNPFVDGAGRYNDYIWARGFRNPFTLAVQPVTGAIWANVAGGTAAGQTNPNTGPGFEQVFHVQRGSHGGYDNWEGNQPGGYTFPVIQYPTALRASTTRALSSAARRDGVATFTTTSSHPYRRHEAVIVTGAGSLSGTVFVQSVVSSRQFTAVQTGPNASATDGSATTLLGGTSSGAAITGGEFYSATAFPRAYRGNFFFGDFLGDKILRARFDGANRVIAVSEFLKGIDSPVDIATGPDGALYCGSFAGQIHRVRYAGAVQEIIVSPSAVNFREGTEAVVSIRLAEQPTDNIEVQVAKTAGDDDIAITGGSSLTFTPANFATPQLVTIAAAVDPDSVRDTATFIVTSAGLPPHTVHANATDNESPNLVLSHAELNLREGQTRAFSVRLAQRPAANLVVTVAHVSGDPDIRITRGSTLTFTPKNWQTRRRVSVKALTDTDSDADSAIIRVSAPGEESQEICVEASDKHNAAPLFVSTPPGALTLIAPSTFFYDAEVIGRPTPVFSLDAAPDGMTIDPASGIVEWRPTTVGTHAVTIRAANGIAPSATQTFQINIADN